MPAAGPATRLETLSTRGLPAWCDAYLAAPGDGDVFAGRAFLDTVLAEAVPEGATPLLALSDAQPEWVLPLLRAADGRLGSLTTPYTLTWRPLLRAGARVETAMQAGGQALGRLLRGQAPARLEALDAALPGLEAFRAGLRDAGIVALPYRHFGNWHEAWPEGLRWDAYLAARPPALRTTIGRKLSRARRELAFDLVTEPGAALEAGIVAYEAVRAASWKPHEPQPRFDAALMRAMAGLGALRLGVLRQRADGQAVAAQYWVVDGGRAWLLKLAHAEAARAGSPGTALTAMMIRHLLDEDGVREMDFGRGDDPYKQLWVGARRQRIGLVLADPRRPAGLAEIARHLAGTARRALGGWVGRR